MTDTETNSIAGSPDVDLPDYEHPPVNETALSIQFAPLASLTPYLGLYWSQFRDVFDSAEALAPLPAVMEQLGKPFVRSRLGFQLVSEPTPRFWLLRAGGTELVQIQNDRFVYNWRQVVGNEIYPRYPTIRRALEVEWGRFCAFLQSEKFPAPDVNQCEVTYVNHIEYGVGWNDYGELNRVIEPWCGKHSGRFLPRPERVVLEAHYRLSEDQGRLHISAEPVVRGRDSKEVLQMTVTARGAPTDGSTGEILRWMDSARCWVVKGFTDFTTSQMHQRWGLKS